VNHCVRATKVSAMMQEGLERVRGIEPPS
jgi:hypothetical protein